MRSFTVRCPECGATLDISGEASAVRCEYCQTVAQIQRRTRWLQRPAPLAQPAPGEPVRPVVLQPRSVAAIVALVTGLMFAGVLAPLALFVGLPALIYFRQAPAAPKGPAVLADVDRDGHLDLVAQLHSSGDNTNYLAAFRTTDGKRLWESPALDDGSYLTQLCVAEDVVLQHRGGSSVRGFALASGALRFAAQLPQRVREVCAGGAPGIARVITIDREAHALSLADGRVSDQGRYVCAQPLRCWGAARSPEHTFDDRPSITLPGMRVAATLTHLASGASVAIGRQAPGAPVPMIAALAPAALQDADPGAQGLFGGVPLAPRWQAQVPERDASSVGSRLDQRQLALDAAAVAVSYEQYGRHRLTVFSLADGRRRFDIELPAEQRSIQTVLLAGDKVLTVSAWGSAAAFDAQRGSRAFTID